MVSPWGSVCGWSEMGRERGAGREGECDAKGEGCGREWGVWLEVDAKTTRMWGALLERDAKRDGSE